MNRSSRHFFLKSINGAETKTKPRLPIGRRGHCSAISLPLHHGSTFLSKNEDDILFHFHIKCVSGHFNGHTHPHQLLLIGRAMCCAK